MASCSMMCAALLFLLAIAIALDPPNPKKDAALPPCGACTNLVSSFEAGMERTKREKLEGGDAAWEEKSGQRYLTSEVRLVEIAEQVCKELARGQSQCHQNYGEWEDSIEAWWAEDPEERPSLRQRLCVDNLAVCCPPDHYGPDCRACSGLGNNGELCSGNGKCKGGGTRKG